MNSSSPSPGVSPSNESLEYADIQGIVLYGYGKLTHAAYLLLSITDPAAARRWLAALRVQSATGDPATEQALNLALTHAGLARLGLPEAALKTFPNEFREGMVTSFRQRILGDLGASDPADWEWGGPTCQPVHLLLMTYAAKPDTLSDLLTQLRASFSSNGLELVKTLDTQWLPEMKEHFGFRDGIMEVPIRGHRGQSTGVAAGEFLLGYENEYGRYTASPSLEDGKLGKERDLGRNGSFLVFRQLEQDVFGFWKWVDDQAKSNPVERVRIAAKMVGRWPNGASLTAFPKGEPGVDTPGWPDTAFNYRTNDLLGNQCPLGAHIRRTNPRDSLGPNTTPGDERLANVHRLIRRGRAYGRPLDPDLNPQGMLEKGADETPRGLHFICFNANIDRQFEFVQQTWSNNAKFAGLRNDPDPLIGARYRQGSQFTIQKGREVRERYVGMPDFVRVRGGGYFFMPSIATLGYLASLDQ